MKKYGYMRKKLYLLSFLLGGSVVGMMWLYSISFLPVGQLNDSIIYSYQLWEYQKSEKYNQMQAVVDLQIKRQAEQDYQNKREAGESFEEYLEKYKRKSTVVIY